MKYVVLFVTVESRTWKSRIRSLKNTENIGHGRRLVKTLQEVGTSRQSIPTPSIPVPLTARPSRKAIYRGADLELMTSSAHSHCFKFR